jgi:hypothetical protein
MQNTNGTFMGLKLIKKVDFMKLANFTNTY